MSEFKFACPVCGQHITADSSTSGNQLECPTCFQRIIVPQAPEVGDTKLILSASKAPTARTAFPAGGGSNPKGTIDWKAKLVPLLALIGTGGVALLLWHKQLSGLANGLAERAAGPMPKPAVPSAFTSPHPVPSNIEWTLNLTNASIPNSDVAGRIHGHGFLCEHATWKSGRLSLRQGPTASPDLGITISLGPRQPAEFAGKQILVNPATPTPGARVVLRWKGEQQDPITEHIHAGYAMNLIFAPVADGRVRGKIYVALPDEEKSFAAGNFEAEIVGAAQPLAGR
jgi:hypothetical protein